MDPSGQGRNVFVVSAPSGAGKHTILRRVLGHDPNLVYSISATTRPPRPGETNGREYYFIDRAEFERRIAAGEFAEWAEVHGNLYGTLRAELDRITASGKDAVLELDVQGMRNVKRIGIHPVTIFIMAPSFEELEQRLRARGTDSDEVIAVRLKNARTEVAAKDEYDNVIVNIDIRDAQAQFEAIVKAARDNSKRK